MKIFEHPSLRVPFSAFLSLFTILTISPSEAVTVNSTYQGPATGTIDTPANWTNGLPSGSGDNGTLTWNGTTVGNLALTYSSGIGVFGAGSGVYMVLAGSQTGSVSIDNSSGSIQRIRTLGITVDSGAGALTYGNGSGAPVEILLGSGAGTFNFVNNSSNVVTFNSEAIIDNGSFGLASLVFGGSGNFDVKGAIQTSVGGVASTVTKGGSGTVALSGANAYAGATTINSGVLSVSNLANGGFSLNTTTVNNSNVVTVASTASLSVGQMVAGYFPAGTTITGITNGTTFTTSANANGSITSVATYGTGNGLGISSNAATNLVINGGTLQYTGAAVSTDRLFSVGTSGGTVDASGTGAVNFTNTGAMGFNAQTGARTLTLTGSNTGSNTLAAAIGDNGGATSLVKSGVGTWVLNGAKTYSGTTTVAGGTLILATDLVSSSSVVVGGGNLRSSVANVNLGVGTVSMSSGTIDPNGVGVIGTFTLAAGQDFITTGGTLKMDLHTTLAPDQIIGSGVGSEFSLSNTTIALNLIGWTAGDYSDTYSLFSGFGSGTLSNINITGYDTANWTASLSNGGVLSFAAVPEPSSAALLALSGIAGALYNKRRRRS